MVFIDLRTGKLVIVFREYRFNNRANPNDEAISPAIISVLSFFNRTFLLSIRKSKYPSLKFAYKYTDFIFFMCFENKRTGTILVWYCVRLEKNLACASQNSRELFGPENISGRFSGVFLGSRKVFLRTPESVPNCLPIFFGNLFVLPATIMRLELAERLF